MKHQIGKKKLNLRAPHRRSMLRNQVIHLIIHGSLTSTKATIKEVKKLAEKVVTIARAGNTFNARRRVKAILPYKDAAIKRLFFDIAPRYIDRSGGYTRAMLLGRRHSDTALIARLEWV